MSCTVNFTLGMSPVVSGFHFMFNDKTGTGDIQYNTSIQVHERAAIPFLAGLRQPPAYQSLHGHCSEQGVLAWALPGVLPCGLPWQPPSWRSLAVGSPPGTLHRQLHAFGCSQNLQMPLHTQKKGLRSVQNQQYLAGCSKLHTGIICSTETQMH